MNPFAVNPEQESRSPHCHESARSVELDHGQSLSLGGAAVRVVYGGVWLVGANRAADYLLDSDEGAVYVPRGATLSSVGRSRVDVVDVDCAAVLRCWMMRVRQLLRWRTARPRPGSAAEEA